MRILPKLTVPSGILLLITGLTSSTVIAQQRPDLEGIWTNASLTDLQSKIKTKYGTFIFTETEFKFKRFTPKK